MNLKPIFFADCCSEIKIVLIGHVLEKQSRFQGTYRIENDLENGRKHWTSLDGMQAIWFDNLVSNSWMIGSSSNRGSNSGGIHSAHDSGCPTQNGMRFKYWNGSYPYLDAPKNSVSLTCPGR